MARRLRLVHLVHGYPPAIGGVELSTATLCERLVRDHDFEVTVLTTDTYGISGFHDPSLPRIPIVRDEVRNGVAIRRFPVVTRWAPALRPLQSAAWRLRLPGNDRLRTWYHGPIAPAMLEALRRTEADVICAASFPLNHMTYPFRTRRGTPVVLVGAVHTNNAWGYDRPHLIRLVGRSHATVAHTEHERDWLVARGAPRDRIHVIGHGIELEALRAAPGRFREAHAIPDDALVVAFVGQQGGHKGIDTLIAAFPDVLAAEPSARLVIAGATTSYSPRLRELVAALPERAAERVLLLDDVDDATRAAVLADCDIFASPSSQEAFGITTLEAWAGSKPVVLGDTPSQHAVAEAGVSAVLVPPGDTVALAARLRELASSPARRAELGAAGHARLLDRYVLADVIGAYARLFRAVAADGPA
ncbi:MAG TPA: glycosyltransferase family 4 protein [Gaiellaceae bacterium]|nr:glycosyltransferase family 4 protein [Gaiellaceae bacterium]